METAPTIGYCSGCRAERRLHFAGYASDGRENGVRPRALYRSCETCRSTMLVLGDATDALGLVRNAILDWKRATGYDDHTAASPALRAVDLDDLEGELTIALWTLYSGWEPTGLSFTSYATGLLPRRLASYVRDAVGSDALYRRNGRGGLCRVWPRAHATSVCISIEGAAEAEPDAGEDATSRLAGPLGAGATDATADRSPDLGRILGARGR